MARAWRTCTYPKAQWGLLAPIRSPGGVIFANHTQAKRARVLLCQPGPECIALTKRKACRASLLWAKRRRGGAVWSNLTSTKAGESKTKLKINHLRLSPEPPELAGFYVDSVLAQTGPMG